MRRLISVIFFWLITLSAFSQVKITVLDQTTNKGLEGVSIVAKHSDQQQLLLTDEGGHISFTGTTFPVTIHASHIGFANQELEIHSDGEYTIRLVARASQLDDVVVTGQFESQSVRQSVYQVRTLSNDRIMMRSPVNVQSALSTELGIRFSNDMALGTSDITLMGMTGRNVKILLDGVPLLDRGDTRESLNQIDINTIERIEIVEGPMSVMYGTDALAGVINIISKKYDSNSLTLEARVHEETAGKEYKGFSGKGVHNQSLNANWALNKFFIGGGLTLNNHGGWKEGRPYFNPNEPAPYFEWHPKDQILTNGTLGYRTDVFSISYRLNYVNEKISPLGNASEPTSTLFVDQDYITNRYNHQLQSDWKINDRWSFSGSATYQDLSRRTLTKQYDSETGRVTLDTEGSQDKAMIDMAMVRGFFLYKLSSVVSLQPGFEVNLTHASGDRIDRDRSINDYAAFISAEVKPTDKINIRPGLRFTYNSVYDAPPVIPSLNTKFSLGKSFDLRLAYAYGFRSPALRELYFYFYDANHNLEGNPDLKAEHSNSFTGSLTWNGQLTNIRVKSTLGSFYNDFKNRIDLAPYLNTNIFKYANISRFKTTGATLENNFTWKNLSFTVGGSYIGRYNELTETDESLPDFTWSPEVNSFVSYAFKKIGSTISVYYKYTGRQQSYGLNTASEIVLGERSEFHMLDASVSQVFLKCITLTIGAKNLLNVTELQNTIRNSGTGHSTDGALVPMSYGRSYFASLAVRWSK